MGCARLLAASGPPRRPATAASDRPHRSMADRPSSPRQSARCRRRRSWRASSTSHAGTRDPSAAADDGLAEDTAAARPPTAGPRRDNKLGEQVVLGRQGVLADAGVDPGPGPSAFATRPSRDGGEAAVQVLGIDRTSMACPAAGSRDGLGRRSPRPGSATPPVEAVTARSRRARPAAAYSSPGSSGRPSSTRNSTVAALWSRPFRRRARAVGQLCPEGRVTAGDGDSSTSFWWRRWTLHSRSPSTAVPWQSPRRALDVPRPAR
jgi:hypothetical protein